MKKLSTLFLTAALVIGASLSANAATNFTINGYTDVTLDYTTSTDIDKSSSNDPFFAAQETGINVGFNSGDVKGGLSFIILGKWGGNTQFPGFALGTDGVNMRTRFAWIDFKIPSTDISVRLGLQPMALPFSLPGVSNTVMANMFAPTASINAPINDMVSVTAFWSRLIDKNVTSSGSTIANDRHDELDVFGVTLPIRYQNYFTATPWVMVGQMGKDIVSQGLPNSNVAIGPAIKAFENLTPVYNPANVANYKANNKNQATPFWLGLPVSLQYFDPFVISADFNYGDNGLNHSNQRSGWYASAMASYKFSNFTPSLMLWYGSGDDSNPTNGSEMIPTLVGVGNTTSFGLGGQNIKQASIYSVASSRAGTWGVRLQVADLSFIEKLNHTLSLAYYAGTSSSSQSNVSAFAGSPIWGNMGNTYLTDKDSAFELNFVNTYSLYDNLTLKANFNVIMPQFSSKVWPGFKDTNIYNLALGAAYTF